MYRLPLQPRLLVLAAFTLLLLANCASKRNVVMDDPADQPPTTIILVRHAEKDFGDDPDLTPAGRTRAQRLAFMLQSLDIDAIYCTETNRTRQTAAPVAELKNLPLLPYQMNGLDYVANRIRRRHQGETVLVVGHSNTTPALTQLLDPNNEYPRFSELDYENMMIVTLPPIGKTQVLNLKF